MQAHSQIYNNKKTNNYKPRTQTTHTHTSIYPQIQINKHTLTHTHTHTPGYVAEGHTQNTDNHLTSNHLLPPVEYFICFVNNEEGLCVDRLAGDYVNNLLVG